MRPRCTAFAARVTSDYPSAAARTLSNGKAGWKGSVAYHGGLCVPSLTCPAVSNTVPASGGAGGGHDGFLRTGLGSLLGVAADSNGTFESAPFAYKGRRARRPTR